MSEGTKISKQKKDRKGTYSYIPLRPATHEVLNKLVALSNLSQIEYVSILVSNVEKMGLDPRELEVQNPANEIKKLRNTLVSFIRTQEKDILVPMVNRVDATVSTLITFLKAHNPQAVSSLPLVPTNTQAEPIKKGKFLIPNFDGEASDPVTNVLPLPSSNASFLEQRTVELEILSEKQQKEILRLKERLSDLASRMVPKSFGSGYTLDISNVEIEEIRNL